MNVFLVDLTHGGVKISTELAKSNNYENIYAYDLYNTLKEDDESLLKTYDVYILKSLEEFKNQLKLNSIDILNLNDNQKREKDKTLIINPIHSSLDIEGILNEISDEINQNKKDLINHYEIINHHKATKLVLNDWKEETIKQNIKTIELTGVKGKTSTAFILKDIFIENHNRTLLLSSLGARLFNENSQKTKEKGLILQKDISITPANIINTIQLAKKIATPKCSSFPKCSNEDLKEETSLFEEFYENPYENLNYDIGVFENSLGVCGLGDIGILTNLIENYPIAKGKSNAKEAKKQVFDCPSVVIDYETLKEYYSEESKEFRDKTNSFSLNNDKSNVYCKSIDYDIYNTKIEIVYNDLKTINNATINGEISLNCFAPGKHHVLNILTAVTTALILEIDEDTIKKGISKFKGIDGRTQVKTVQNTNKAKDSKNNDLIIIEEINPGINTKAIESSINMIKDIENYYIIIGGKYGVTCEEIDEDKLSKYLNDYISKNPNTNIILCDELGKSLKDKLNLLNNEIKVKYLDDYNKAQNIAIGENKNILFIYRSNYSQVSKR